MNKAFFQSKIKTLTDDKVLDLLRKVSYGYNPDILSLAKDEAEKRHLIVDWINGDTKYALEPKHGDEQKLRKWNWGAFLLAPVWSSAHKLEKWTFLCFIPGLNIFAMFYLGQKGNSIAFKKTKIYSVDDFMMIQDHWKHSGIKLLWFGIAFGLIVLILDSTLGTMS